MVTPTSIEAWRPAYEAAQKTWPQVKLPIEAFVAHVAAVGAEPPGSAAAETFATDLFLACACAAGDAIAIALLERSVLQPARAAIARVRSDDAFVDEVTQLLREKLLVGPPARIAGYAGRAPLGAWVRLAAGRLALDRVRTSKTLRGHDPESDADALTDARDPELDFLKAAYRDSFKRAMHTAIEELSSRDRNVLRLNLIEGVSIDEIAVPYRVHRATVARWLTAIREQLVERVRALLAAQHPDLQAHDLEHMAHAVGSQLHVSLSRVLALPENARPRAAGPGPQAGP